MRIIFTTGILLSIVVSGFSQDELFVLHNKMSINLFSYMQRAIVMDKNDYYPMVMHGLIYTHQIVPDRYVRVRFDYFQKNIDRSVPHEYYYDTHFYSDIDMGVGYVAGFGEKKVKPYLAADLVLISALIYTETGGRDAGTYEKRQVRRLGISVLPAVGVTIQVSTIVSFSVETNFELGYARENGTDFTWAADDIPLEKPVKQSLFISRWNPVGMLAFELSF